MPALSNEGGISLSHKPDSLMFMVMSNGVKRKDRLFLFLVGRKPKSEFRLREAVTFKCVKARTTAVSHEYISTCSTQTYLCIICFSFIQNNKKVYFFLNQSLEQNSCMINYLYWIVHLIFGQRLYITFGCKNCSQSFFFFPSSLQREVWLYTVEVHRKNDPDVNGGT